MTQTREAAAAAEANSGEPGQATGHSGWTTVARQELQDLWAGGRGPTLVFAFSVLLSVVTYLSATNQVLNFLEQREAVSLVLQLAVAVGVLLTLVLSADAVSGERERGTLETLLLTPVSRRGILVGKLVAAGSFWFAALATTVPYVWVLGRGVSVVGSALLLGLSVGTLLALALASLGLVISGVASSNRVSLATSLFVLLALFAPTLLPSGTQKGWLGDVLVRLNPIGSGLHYIGVVLVDGHHWTADLSYLVSPAITAVVATSVLVAAARRLVRLDAAVFAG